MNQVSMSETDRISSLPDHICHQILQGLPVTEARMTTFLNRRWRFMFYSCPSYEFDDSEFDTASFIRFVNDILQFRQRYFSNLSIDSFRLCMNVTNEAIPHIDNWIKIVLQKEVKNLDISLTYDDMYKLPESVLTTASITELKMVNCEINCNNASLPLIRKFVLERGHVADKGFEKWITSCPLLEDLRIIAVQGLNKICISSQKLKVFELLAFTSVDFSIDAPNLEYFTFSSDMEPRRIRIATKKVRCLSLRLVHPLTDDLIQDIFANNPLIECVFLDCKNLRKMIISSQKLRYLEVKGCRKVVEVGIEAPSLQILKYNGDLVDLFGINCPLLMKASISLRNVSSFDAKWYCNLKRLCENLDHCPLLTLRTHMDKGLVIPMEMRESLLPRLYGPKQLKVHLCTTLTSPLEIEHGLNWIFSSLKTLCINLHELEERYFYEYDGIERRVVTRSQLM
ncbi:hypothetical protein ACJIZ3_005148 [Penstemon smallii]|uniref:F-box/LRR-repeat protein 15/At3g58940/PEG3-like LRR domain-containing protein n=1 Tax=Penstemon smallii TaxID=265156 RepID=A0ABD3S418_9LAMI